MDFQHNHVIRQTQNLGPATQGSIHGNLMMLNLLRSADKRDVSDRSVRHVLDRIGGFGGQAVDNLTGFSLAFADIALQQTFDPGDVSFGFFQVSLKSRSQF